MKVQIIKSFVVPPSAPFQLGEVIDVPKATADAWIEAGRALPHGVPVSLPPMGAPSFKSRERQPRVTGRLAKRETR